MHTKTAAAAAAAGDEPALRSEVRRCVSATDTALNGVRCVGVSTHIGSMSGRQKLVEINGKEKRKTKNKKEW